MRPLVITRTYVVNWPYRAGPLAYGNGDRIDITDDMAEWLNRDSPGVVTLAVTTTAEAASEAPNARDVQDAPNRMMASAPRRRGRPAKQVEGVA